MQAAARFKAVVCWASRTQHITWLTYMTIIRKVAAIEETRQLTHMGWKIFVMIIHEWSSDQQKKEDVL